MKKLVIGTALLLTQSCAMLYPSMQAVFVADSTGTSKCAPVIEYNGMYNIGKKVSEKELQEWQDFTGYSECKVTKNDKFTKIIECEKPFKYKSVVSLKAAQCNAVLAEFNVQK